MLRKPRISLAVLLLAASLPITSGAEKPAAPAAEPAGKAPPPIADPKVKRLVEEARTARIATDTAAAMVKLDEARELGPKAPNVLYEQALLFEEMAKYDHRLKESVVETFQAIFDLGAEKAGSLHDIAAKKLANGI